MLSSYYSEFKSGLYLELQHPHASCHEDGGCCHDGESTAEIREGAEWLACKDVERCVKDAKRSVRGQEDCQSERFIRASPSHGADEDNDKPRPEYREVRGDVLEIVHDGAHSAFDVRWNRGVGQFVFLGMVSVVRSVEINLFLRSTHGMLVRELPIIEAPPLTNFCLSRSASVHTAKTKTMGWRLAFEVSILMEMARRDDKMRVGLE